MRFAIVENEIVVNTIEASQSFVDEHFPNAINIEEVTAGIGWTYNKGKFIAPPIVEETIE
jgi:flavin reductase (DIM6/NTAB) family NADH-FMN oxidoreductase RutF